MGTRDGKGGGRERGGTGRGGEGGGVKKGDREAEPTHERCKA
jgi:hypothetical protein